MTWLTELSPQLQGVVVGGLIAGGVAILSVLLAGIGWFIRHKVQASAQRDDLRRIKLEHVLNELLAIDGWFDEQLARLKRNDEATIANPASRALALLLAYGPESLHNDARALRQASLVWAGETRKMTGDEPADPNVQAQVAEATRVISLLSERLLQAVTEEVRRLSRGSNRRRPSMLKDASREQDSAKAT